MAQRARDAVAGTVDVRLEYDRDEAESEPPALAHLSPQELFVRYYRSHHGAQPAPELIALFTELLDDRVSQEAVAAE